MARATASSRTGSATTRKMAGKARLSRKATLGESSATSAASKPKAMTDKLLINLIDTPVWHYMVREGVHEHGRRFYDEAQDAGRLYAQDTSIRSLVEPSLAHAAKHNLSGDELYELINGAMDAVDKHKSGSMQLTREFIKTDLANAVQQLQATTTRYNYKWSARTALIALMFNYANFLVKNDYKDIALLR